MNKINVNLYSRQISAYCLDIMLKINNMKFIILGMGGLGVEISKNIILTGVFEISFFDDKICSMSDLSSNFFKSEEDINKKRRDEACLPKLRDLNREIIINRFESLEIMKNNINIFSTIIRLRTKIRIKPFFFIN